jgi:PTS system fructose-specific IIC component
MAAGTSSPAPHGGFFVLFAIGKPLWFVIAILVGTVASALAVIAAKEFIKPTAKAEDAPALATA